MKILLLPLALLLAAASSSAAELPAKPITIVHAYSHPTAAPGVPGVGFLTLTNTGKQPDRLLSASSPAAGQIEIHQSSMANGVMQMRAVSQGVALPVGQAVTLAPGGLHLMLFQLREPLAEGQSLPLTLHFERAGSVSTTLKVESREPPAAPQADHSHHAH
ncbi:MAG: copper chaperone PCu(A)C [Pseudomonadota bacterium]